jgi:hypothetical protein
MKHFVIILFLALGLFACDIDHHGDKYAVFTNESDYPVIYKFTGIGGEGSLGAKQSVTFDSYVPIDLEYYAPEKRVSYSYDYGYYVYGTFRNLPSWKIRVNNKLSTPVTLSADGWMEEMENITPGSADDQNHTGLIFTDNPAFTAIVGSFPAMTNYAIVDDTMYVTIQ